MANFFDSFFIGANEAAPRGLEIGQKIADSLREKREEREELQNELKAQATSYKVISELSNQFGVKTPPLDVSNLSAEEQIAAYKTANEFQLDVVAGIAGRQENFGIEDAQEVMENLGLNKVMSQEDTNAMAEQFFQEAKSKTAEQELEQTVERSSPEGFMRSFQSTPSLTKRDIELGTPISNKKGSPTPAELIKDRQDIQKNQMDIEKMETELRQMDPTSDEFKQLSIAKAQAKAAEQKATGLIDVQEAADIMGVIAQEVNDVMNEVEKVIPDFGDQGFGGYIARTKAKILGSKVFDEFPKLAAFRDNIQADATKFAKAAGEQRPTDDDIQRFVLSIFDPSGRSLASNIEKAKAQVRRIKAKGANPFVLEQAVSVLEDRLEAKNARQEEIDLGSFTFDDALKGNF